MLGGSRKMIKEKYMQLLAAHQIKVITTIGDIHKLQYIKKTKNEKNFNINNIFDSFIFSEFIWTN